MLKWLKSLRAPRPLETPEPPLAAPQQVTAEGVEPFDVRAALVDAYGLPVLDWDVTRAWIATISREAAQAEAWAACERAWLAQLGVALGPAYRLQGQGSALLLSTLSAHVAEATLAFVNKTVQRILRTLDGVASTAAWGQDILIVFDDDETYYRYVSHCYPEAGEFAASSGMYIQHGCGHFVTVKGDLHAVEPVIAHELAHACLGVVSQDVVHLNPKP